MKFRRLIDVGYGNGIVVTFIYDPLWDGPLSYYIYCKQTIQIIVDDITYDLCYLTPKEKCPWM